MPSKSARLTSIEPKVQQLPEKCKNLNKAKDSEMNHKNQFRNMKKDQKNRDVIKSKKGAKIIADVYYKKVDEDEADERENVVGTEADSSDSIDMNNDSVDKHSTPATKSSSNSFFKRKALNEEPANTLQNHQQVKIRK